MQFANPSILWFLFALMIPVIIHLFYFRRYKRLYFSDTRFLQEAQEVQKNASRLKHLLVLLCRLLAFAFLIFAFAQPFIRNDATDKGEYSHISIFIDNSFSMEASKASGTLLEEAKRIALESINEFPEYFTFHVFDHDFEGEDQQWINRDQAINKIKTTELTGQVRTLSEIVGRQRQMRDRLDDDTEILRYVITDGQQNIFSTIPDFGPNESIQVIQLDPLTVNNLSIDSAWIEDPSVIPGQQTKLYVKLSNNGNGNASGTNLEFDIDGATRPAGVFDIPTNSHVIDTIPLSFSSGGWKTLNLRVSDDAIRFDDELTLTIQVRDRIDVLLINDNQHESYFRAAISSTEHMNLERQAPSQILYSSFNRFDLIIVDGLANISTGLSTELVNFVESGGNVLFFPKDNGDVNSYNSLFKDLDIDRFSEKVTARLEVYSINQNSYIFKNVYRRTGQNLKTPTVESYYKTVQRPTSGKESLLKLRNGDSYLTGYNRGSGHVYICTSPTNREFSDILSQGSFFVPMIHRMSLSSSGGIHTYYVIGGSKPIQIKSSEDQIDPVYKLTGAIEIIPARYKRSRATFLYASDQISEQGLYNLTLSDSLLAKVAFNYNRSESSFERLSNEEIVALSPLNIKPLEVEQGSSIAKAIVTRSTQTTFWKWCLILALISLAIEQLLLRYFRR